MKMYLILDDVLLLFSISINSDNKEGLNEKSHEFKKHAQAECTFNVFIFQPT